MRQLPANSSSGGSSENRSRSHLSNDASRVKLLSNGSIKEPIVTRSKSRLRGGRHSDRSPRKPSTPAKGRNEALQKKKSEKKKVASAPTPTVRPPSASPNNVGSGTVDMYARHYKSYRGLNGVKSRRGEKSLNEDNQLNKLPSKSNNKISSNCSRRLKETRNLKSSGKIYSNSNKKNHSYQNGISSRSSSSSSSPASTPSQKATRDPSTRIRQLILKRKKQLSSRKLRRDVSPPKSPTPKIEIKEEPEDSDRERDKAGKRRSALWVLNCEAESFLFGETAAEKHEVELPPLPPPSPPPKKRRWRATELGHLLEKSPILESKLRKSSSSESSGSDMQSKECSPPRKRLKFKPEVKPAAGRRVKNSSSTSNKMQEETLEMCSSKSVKGHQQEQQKVLSPKPELLSPIPFLYSPDSIDYEAKTVQFHQMLNNLDFGYSFERAPVHEGWYDVFRRTESSIVPFTHFMNPLDEPLVLPYEMDKPLRRSRTKPAKNSRKSPRCHASTLAILSSEKPTRSTRSSVASDTSPPSAAVNNPNSPTESTLRTLLLTPTTNSSVQKTPTTTSTANTSTPTTSAAALSKIPPPKRTPTPTTPRRRNPSSVSPKSTYVPNSQYDTKTELGAAQYLWDSIQLLSDPYVVTLLSGDEPVVASCDHSEHHSQNPKGKGGGMLKNHRCTNNNYVQCPVKYLIKHHHMQKSPTERRASLRSGDGPSSTPVNNIPNCKLVSTPKSSPRLQSHQGTNNHVGGGQSHHHHNCMTLTTSPAVSPSAGAVMSSCDRVQPVNGVTKRFMSRSPPLSPPRNHEKCNSLPKSLNCKNNSKGVTFSNLSSTSVEKSQLIRTRKCSGSDGDNGLIPHDKLSVSNKKTPIVLVADLYTASCKKGSSWEQEASLFNGDELPPLPQWPV